MDKINKYVNGVGVHPGAFVVTCMEDGGADVARESIGLGGWWQWGVVLGGDWLGVQFVDNVDVGIVNGGNRGRGGCSCDSRAELVTVGCALGGSVVTG